MIIDHSLGCAECGGACRGLGSCYDDYISKKIDLMIPANAATFRACQAAEVAIASAQAKQVTSCPPGFHNELQGIVDYALNGLGICVEDRIYGPIDKRDGKGLVKVGLTEFKAWQISEQAYQEKLQKEQYAALLAQQAFANNQAALQAQQAQAQKEATARAAAEQAEAARLAEIARQQALAKSNATAAAQKAASEAAAAQAAALIASQNAVVQAAQIAAAKATQDAKAAEAAKQAKIARETCPPGFHWEESGISGLGVLSACVVDTKMPNNKHSLNEQITDATQPSINWLKTEGIISGVPNWVLLGVAGLGLFGLIKKGD